MRRKEKEIKDTKEIENIIKSSQICRIAISDEEFPYIVPMNYGYNNNSLYFHCALNGRKIDLLRRNNKVGFEIEQHHKIIKDDVSCNWTTKYRSIIGHGIMEIIEDFEQKKDGLDILMQQHGKEDNIYNDKAVSKVLILKLSIKSISAKQSGDY